METNQLIQKLNSSQLFPENIRNFLIEGIRQETLNEGVLQELSLMIQEENKAVKDIEDKKEDAFKRTSADRQS